MFNTILFDMDGVVVDSESLWDIGTEALLNRYGRVYVRAKSKHLCTGKSLLEGTAIMQQIYQIEGNPLKLAAELKIIIKDLYRTKLSYMNGFVDFMKLLQSQGLKAAIATTCDGELIQLAEEKLKLSRYFGKNIFTIADVNFKSKPAPDIYLYAARQLNSHPEHCIVIEDSPFGIEAAKCAGMVCIGLATSYEHAFLDKADLIVNSFSEIDLRNFGIG